MQTAGNSRGHAAVRLSILGITAGVMTLVAVLAVMNGFQSSTIRNILEVSSYHLRVELPAAAEDETLRELRGLPNVSAVVPFRDVQALARGFFQTPATVLLRGVPEDLLSLDPGLAEQLELLSGSFELAPGSVVVGSELARTIGAGVGDTISLVHLPDADSNVRRPRETSLLVTGVFRTGYLDFDRSWAFISFSEARGLFGVEDATLGIKLKNRYQDRVSAEGVREVTEGAAESGLPRGRVVSWREFNRGIFGALRVEKSMMLLLVGLIFLVVATNIFHTLNRSVAERQEEIALLRAIGATPKEVTRLFLGQGIFIGFSGATLGLLLGLFLSVNINGVFEAVELVINGVLSILARLSSGLTAEGVEIFSSRDFYLAEVPVEIPYAEALLVYLFAVVSATVAGYAASRRVGAVSPASVLREEVNG